MSAQKDLILIPSEKMDNNRKEGRNEDGLVRMSKAVRTHLGVQDKVELAPKTKNVNSLLKQTIMLDIFQAFSADIKRLRAEGFSLAELKKVGFVTTKTYNKVTGRSRKTKSNVWITEDFSYTVIGADPEFLLFNDDGEVVRANNVLGYSGQLGCDGAMAEVRPSPAITPEELVTNIRVLFENDSLVSNIKPYKWKAGCYFKDQNRDYPIGGHIHIGNPVKVAQIPEGNRTHFFKAFNKILDELLAVPMIKLDGARLGKARRSECAMATHGPGFGRFGRFRLCHGHLEHRTLSGMWLMHPDLSTMVFGTAKAIIDEVYGYAAQNKFDMHYMFPSNMRNVRVWESAFDKWNEIPITADLGCVADSGYMTDMLNNSPAGKITKAYLANWYGKMRKLSTYNKYSQYIDDLYEVLKINTKTFHSYKHDLQKAWVEGRSFLK